MWCNGLSKDFFLPNLTPSFGNRLLHIIATLYWESHRIFRHTLNISFCIVDVLLAGLVLPKWIITHPDLDRWLILMSLGFCRCIDMQVTSAESAESYFSTNARYVPGFHSAYACSRISAHCNNEFTSCEL